MGGYNLEVFKFGLYIMAPIGTMFWFGTNLDRRFAVPDFWPKPEETNRIPYEKEDIKDELARLRARRLRIKEQRVRREAEGAVDGES